MYPLPSLRAYAHMSAIVAVVVGGLSLIVFIIRPDPSLIPTTERPAYLSERFFAAQSIDTMKQSRDRARQYKDDPAADRMMAQEMRLITEAGATHVAIGTPYDEEFIPVLERWVAAARTAGLSVWFRGNFSGWEGWFGYGRISPTEHRRLLDHFLETHHDLFRDGDMFSPCPECENGGPGDPRRTGGHREHMDFMRREYELAVHRFAEHDLDVKVYASMNADIAREVFDARTTNDIGGAILIDHYVSSPERLVADIVALQEELDTSIGVGEFGAPIPDLHPGFDERAQARYIRTVIDGLAALDRHIPVISYWTLSDSSTALLNSDLSRRDAFDIIAAYYSPRSIHGTSTDTLGRPLSDVLISIDGSAVHAFTQKDGSYRLLVPTLYDMLYFEKDGYAPATISLPGSGSESESRNSPDAIDVVLEPTDPSLWYRFRMWVGK